MLVLVQGCTGYESEEAMFRKILVAVDGSEHARRALETAIDIARRYDATLCLLHAFPHVSDLLGTPFYEQMIESRTMIGRSLLESARTQVGDLVPVEEQLLQGPAAPAILRVADVERCDLIVLGSRGHSQIGGILLGSVSNVVAQRAHCPVMVVH
jgi:nucleotide-binding universal stress UspA family protein